MKVIRARNRFELIEFTEEEGKQAAKSGWRLDGRKFCYFTASPEITSPYISYSDSTIQQEILRHQASIFFSRATVSNLNFPCPTGLAYLPFQQIGIAYSSQRLRSLIGDEPGLGKTVQAIGVMNANPIIKNVLVVCPAVIKLNWIREIQKWFLRCESLAIAYPPSETYFPSTNIVVINYDIVEKWRPEIDRRSWDLLVVDESQSIKNSEAKRTIAILGGKIKRLKIPPIQAKKYLFLSGTPLVNRPADLWTLVKACDPDDLGDTWDYYARRYCKLWHAPWGWDSSGAANLEELQNRLRGKFMIRRLKSDVLSDLPPKRRQIVIIEPQKAVQELLEKERQAYEKVKNKLEITIEAAEAAIKAAEQRGDLAGYKTEARELTGANFGEFAELSRIRHEVAVAKIPYSIEYIRLMLESHDKIVVFAHHRDVLEAIRQAFTSKLGTVVVHGGQGEKERQDAIDKFQEDDKYRLILVSITCAIGFTLHRASYALAVELDWRSTVMCQAEDRLHRIGQKEAVLIQHLVYQNSMDALQVRKIIEKQDIIDRALG